MKRQKFRIKIESEKQRKTWQIDPRTRVYRDGSYKRSKEKEALKKLFWDEDEEYLP